MTARFLWKQRKSLRRIDKRARETADPVERLRYVRSQMECRWGPKRRIAAVIAAAIGVALLVWRIY
jgi:hypothetical protein